MLRKILLIFIIFISPNVLAENNRIIIASTTSTYDSGFFDYINQEFNKKYPINIHILSLGTGQAIEVAKNGDADILLVHHKPSELKFIQKEYGVKRHRLMYNDYILVGPKFDNDNCDTIKNTLQKIKDNKYIFISRGDNSGTNYKEKELWNSMQVDTGKISSWYKEIGQGMGSTLNFANEIHAYTLTDRGSWLSFNNKDNLKIICEYKPNLINQYSIIAVNPKINPKINSQDANIYVNWIISEEGKKLINNFKINNQQIFFFNHH